MSHGRAVSILAVFVLAQSCLAADRGAPVQQTQQQLMSHALPGALSKFVERVGADRPLKDVSAENLASLLSGQPDPAAVLDILRPSACADLLGPATLAKAVARPQPQDPTGSLETLLVAGGMVDLDDGTEIPLGGTLPLGSVVRRGLILNAGQTDVTLENEEGETTLAPGEAVWLACATQCSVGCGSGYYACCWLDNGCARCKCFKVGTPYNCDGGGEGAAECSIGQVTVAEETTDDETPIED